MRHHNRIRYTVKRPLRRFAAPRREARFLSALVILITLTAATDVPRAAEPPARPPPLAVAHQGLLRHAPENTLANFRACLNLRVGFELDVRRSKDGQLACIHDDTLDRTTNGTGPAEQKTLAELKRLDAGSWYDPAFRGQRIPTIDEVFQLVSRFKSRAILIAVDLKADDGEVEADVVQLAQKHKVLDRLLFIGRTIDNEEVRSRLRKADKNAHTAALANNSSELKAALDDTISDWAYVRFVPTASEIKAIRRAGKKCFIAGSTVAGRKPENWIETREAGVDAVLTDYPLVFQEIFRKTRP